MLINVSKGKKSESESQEETFYNQQFSQIWFSVFIQQCFYERWVKYINRIVFQSLDLAGAGHKQQNASKGIQWEGEKTPPSQNNQKLKDIANPVKQPTGEK